MRLRLIFAAVLPPVAVLTPAALLAEAFQRPIPAPQTAQAEASYLVASLLLLMALIAVQWLVARR